MAFLKRGGKGAALLPGPGEAGGSRGIPRSAGADSSGVEGLDEEEVGEGGGGGGLLLRVDVGAGE